MRSREIYNQRFHRKSAGIFVRLTGEEVCIGGEGMSASCMKELMDELIYDGYADSGEVSEGSILLYGADPWMCGEESLKEMIQAKMESMNYEVTFLP